MHIWNGSYMNCGYEIKWSYDPRSYEGQFLQLRKKAWKIQDFNGVWSCDLAIPVRRSNQLSYVATDVGSWSFVGSNVPRERMNQRWNDIWNGSFMNCGYEIKWNYDPLRYQRNFCNCVKKPEKFRTSTGFEPVTSRYRCDAVANWALKPLTLGAGHLWVLMFPCGMNQRWNDIWNGSYMKCGYEIKWSYDPRSYEGNFCNCGKKPEKFRTSTGFERGLNPLKSWIFQASLRNCKNCVPNCEDHNFTWLNL